MRQKKLIRFKQRAWALILVSGVAMLPSWSARAVQSVTLAWNPSPSANVHGYQICFSTNSHNYNNQISVSRSTTNTTIWGLVAGKTYYFAARSYQSAQVQSDYSTELSYTVPPDAANQPPILTRLLKPKTYVVGQNLSFCIAALGNGALKYQWHFNGQNLANATNAVLALNNLRDDQAGTYSVTVLDDIGTTNASPVELTLHVPIASTQIAATLTTVTGLAVPTGVSKQYAFDVSGVAGDTYVVEASANLRDWTSVATNTAPFTFIDTNIVAAGQMFYRGVHQ